MMAEVDMKTEQYYDQLFNISTGGIQDWSESTPHFNRYEATPYSALDLLFTMFDLPHKGRIIDFGSGKGRIPIYLHHHFPNQVCGIERNQSLYEQALTNTANYQKKHRVNNRKLDWIRGQAEEYEIRKEDCIFYFFNPFSLSIFSQVVMNIFKSFEEHPRPIYLILFYETKEYRDWIERYTTLSIIQEVEVSVTDPYERFVIYTN